MNVRGLNATLPVSCVLSLIGGLALVAAYFMPWFGSQGLLLSGQFLTLFLSGTTDLRRVMPGASGTPEEVLQLRLLVDLFPAAGVLATLLALIAAARRHRLWGVLLILCGGVPLLALLIGVGRLPPGSSFEVGLLTIGLGALCTCAGGVLELARG